MPAQAPAPDIDDPLAVMEPSSDEIAAAAKEEAKATAQPPQKRPPGRPRGSKTRTPQQKAAAAGQTTRQRVRTPKETREERDARLRHEAEEREKAILKRADEWAQWLKTQKVPIVGGIGMVFGIPGEYLIELEPVDSGQRDENGATIYVPRVDAQGNPVLTLSAYGQSLAPADWQLKAQAKAAARLVESEVGAKLLEMWSKYGVYLWSAGALAALGIYTVQVMQNTKAIKEMVAVDQKAKQQQQDSRQAEPGSFGGDGIGEPGGASTPAT